jgi:predicted RNA binding protein YcfA (HicA-like mRNA interferase family)
MQGPTRTFYYTVILRIFSKQSVKTVTRCVLSVDCQKFIKVSCKLVHTNHMGWYKSRPNSSHKFYTETQINSPSVVTNHTSEYLHYAFILVASWKQLSTLYISLATISLQLTSALIKPEESTFNYHDPHS